MGDVVLKEEDVVSKRDFPDGCVPSTWSIDLHYPKEQYAAKFPENPFISKAVHGKGVDRSYGYPVPYRCFYSRNIDNLFMAGRNISVTHEALGTVRVMKTCGMMGEVVGKAASLCTLNGCKPRDVYQTHLSSLLELLKLPGKAHRSTPSGDIIIPDDILPLAGPTGPMTGNDPAKLDGIVVDDKQAKLTGKWTSGTGLKNYVGWSYLYASGKSKATATFTIKVKEAGDYKVQLFSQSHKNRATNTPVTIEVAGKLSQHQVNQREKSPNDVLTVTQVSAKADSEVVITLNCEGADGTVHVDAARLLRVQ
jgi:hypothetical protein